MSSKDGRSAFLSAVRTTAASRTLINLYQRLAGELAKAASGETTMIPPEEAKAVMRHILATLSFLGVPIDRRKLKARRTRIQIGPLDYGGLSRGILRALKASGDWMSYEEIMDVILRANHVELTADRRKHFLQKVRESIFILRSTGLLQCEHAIAAGDGSKRQRWKLVDSGASPPAS